MKLKRLTILVASVPAVGHVNACLGALAPLLRRGHRIVFMLEEAFRGRAASLGFEEVIMNFGNPVNIKNAGEIFAKMFLDGNILGSYSVEEKMQNTVQMFHNDKNYHDCEIFDHKIKEAILTYKPDLFYVDHPYLLPSIFYSGIPWIKNFSTTPIFYTMSEHLPPGGSGYSANGRKTEFDKFNQIRMGLFKSKKFSNFVQKLGYEPYENDSICPDTQCLTVYGYPEELNYPFIAQQEWFNLEVFNKNEQKEVIDFKQLIPNKIFTDNLGGKFSGKWIYVSLGTMGSVDLDLMNRLVSVLGQTSHKYIVSKGMRHAEFNLAHNMYGELYLEQIKILPLVDLVITHGGNNTVTETFSQGKPMIVLPLFGDQFDNAQRLEETGFGARLDPYQFTDDQLISTIERLLNNTELARNLQSMAQAIQTSNRHEELANKIEELFYDSM